jgi:nucleoside-diphosphate-sugar epimerase
MQGAKYVIHAAVGGREATVEGTRNVMQAALDAGVDRVVHLSTVDVYGRATGTVSEDVDFGITGREYGDTKIEAEQVCLDFASKGLEVVMLRPTIVYGPFSELWTVEPAQRVWERGWSVPRELCQGRCNLVFVDDLVRATLLALTAPGVSGGAFNVNGPDEVTWQEYIDALNRELGLEPIESASMGTSRVRTALTDPVRALVKKVFYTFEDPIMAVYKSSKLAKRLMKGLESGLRGVPSQAEYDLYSRDVHFPSDRARDALGYEPLVDMSDGVALSVAWLRHEGVVS